MTEITFTLETLTPLFLGGADQLADVELRPASVRGALRFWYRALWAGIYGDDLKALRQAESAVFGDTSTGSQIVVRLSGNPRSEPLSIQPPRRESEPGGAAYMFWSVLRQKRLAISPNKTFALGVQSRPNPMSSPVENDSALRQALAALWLLTHLGGLGSRARRGGGNLAIHLAEAKSSAVLLDSLPSWDIRANSLVELQNELAEGLKLCRNALGGTAWCDKSKVTLPPTFDILHPQACDIRVLNRGPFPDWQAALEDVGQAFKSFRNRRPPDYANVKAATDMQKNFLQPIRRAAFGLPIVFYFKSLNGARSTLEGETHDRRASPLSFRLIRLANKQFAVALITFKSQLLGEIERNERIRPERLRLRRERDFINADVPDLALIDDFIKSLGSSLEVKP